MALQWERQVWREHQSTGSGDTELLLALERVQKAPELEFEAQLVAQMVLGPERVRVLA